MNLLNFNNQENFINLEWNKKIYRELNELDKKPTRKVFTCSIIYIGLNQRTQSQILLNMKGSASYEEFVNSLGWDIDILQHVGYKGQLGKRHSSFEGKTTCYYSNFENELIFHLPTRMPNKKNDQMQLHKLKHIINDFVHIIWCEDNKKFNPSLFNSKFNFVQFIIYPLPNGMFCINIVSKSEIKVIGPVTDGMIINKQLLPHYIRNSVTLICNYIYYYVIGNYKEPFQVRENSLKNIIEKYKKIFNFEDYYSKSFSDKQPDLSIKYYNSIINNFKF